jgi:hypothetical protein
MHMVFDAACNKGLAIELAKDAAKITMQLFA